MFNMSLINDSNFSNKNSYKLNLFQNEKEKITSKLFSDNLNSQLKAKGFRNVNKLGQGEFLKLLVTQLKHQDPLSPMKDKNFIAQMAQFSSLEQMTKVNKQIKSLIHQSIKNSSYQLLGKKVHWRDNVTDKIHKGIVNSIEKKVDQFKLIVGKIEIDFKNILKIENSKVGI